MEIIPAIDIIGGKVVRLEMGRFNKSKFYMEDPVEKAKEWSGLGARLLHVVDLDGAKTGTPKSLGIVKKIVSSVEADIELGGGLRKEEDIESALRAGVKFVVVGTRAIQDEAFCGLIAEKYSDKVVFAVDVEGGRVAIKGWKENSGITAEEYIKRLEKLGAKKIIYTDISRDGMMTGPNLEALKAILRSTDISVIASGGVSSIDDIKALKGIGGGKLSGVIIGKALYEGKIDLNEAMTYGAKAT